MKVAPCMLLWSSLSQGQNALPKHEVDSLWSVWSNPKEADTNRLNAIDRIAWHGFINTNPDSAYHFAQLQYDFAKKKESKKGMGVAIYTQGTVKRIQGDVDEALKLYNRSLELHLESDNKRGIVNCLNGIGNIHRDQGNYREALSKYQDCLRIHEKLGDTGGQAASFSNLGILYSFLGDRDKALEYHF